MRRPTNLSPSMPPRSLPPIFVPSPRAQIVAFGCNNLQSYNASALQLLSQRRAATDIPPAPLPATVITDPTLAPQGSQGGGHSLTPLLTTTHSEPETPAPESPTLPSNPVPDPLPPPAAKSPLPRKDALWGDASPPESDTPKSKSAERHNTRPTNQSITTQPTVSPRSSCNSNPRCVAGLQSTGYGAPLKSILPPRLSLLPKQGSDQQAPAATDQQA